MKGDRGSKHTRKRQTVRERTKNARKKTEKKKGREHQAVKGKKS
jgi:hypothetical protein